MSIPCDVLVFNIAAHLQPRDQLAIAMCTKQAYKTFFEVNPNFRALYSQKHQAGKVIRRMLEFVRKGPTGVATWSFLLEGSTSNRFLEKKQSCKKELVISRSANSCYSVTGQHVPDLFAWFSANMWPRKEEMMISTRCCYKKRNKRDEFMDLTNKILALSHGL